MKDLMARLPGKLLIADRGFQTAEPDEDGVFALPGGPQEVKLFKTCGGQRQETFNGHLKHYKILQDVFCFNPNKHADVFKAVLVRVHYQMESGTPLFDVYLGCIWAIATQAEEDRHMDEFNAALSDNIFSF